MNGFNSVKKAFIIHSVGDLRTTVLKSIKGLVQDSIIGFSCFLVLCIVLSLILAHLVEVVCGLPGQVLELTVALKHPGGEGARLRVIGDCKRERNLSFKKCAKQD